MNNVDVSHQGKCFPLSLQTFPYCLHVHQAFCKIIFSSLVLHLCDYHKPPPLAPALWGKAHAGGFPCIFQESDTLLTLFEHLWKQAEISGGQKNPKVGNLTCFGIFFYKAVLKILVEALFHRLFPLKLSYNMAISPTQPFFHRVALNQNIFSSFFSVDICLGPFSIPCVTYLGRMCSQGSASMSPQPAFYCNYIFENSRTVSMYYVQYNGEKCCMSQPLQAKQTRWRAGERVNHPYLTGEKLTH